MECFMNLKTEFKDAYDQIHRKSISTAPHPVLYSRLVLKALVYYTATCRNGLYCAVEYCYCICQMMSRWGNCTRRDCNLCVPLKQTGYWKDRNTFHHGLVLLLLSQHSPQYPTPSDMRYLHMHILLLAAEDCLHLKLQRDDFPQQELFGKLYDDIPRNSISTALHPVVLKALVEHMASCRVGYYCGVISPEGSADALYLLFVSWTRLPIALMQKMLQGNFV